MPIITHADYDIGEKIWESNDSLVYRGISKKSGHPISFGTYFKASFMLTFISLVISTVYVYLRYFIL